MAWKLHHLFSLLYPSFSSLQTLHDFPSFWILTLDFLSHSPFIPLSLCKWIFHEKEKDEKNESWMKRCLCWDVYSVYSLPDSPEGWLWWHVITFQFLYFFFCTLLYPSCHVLASCQPRLIHAPNSSHAHHLVIIISYSRDHDLPSRHSWDWVRLSR